jgi:F-type H+-transporting ATPase subunit epsilon
LKEEKRLQAERRGETELRFAKWNVSSLGCAPLVKEFQLTIVYLQAGKQGENKSVAEANAASMAEAGSQSS